MGSVTHKFLKHLSSHDKVFLDTMCFIYHTGNHPDYSPLTETVFTRIQHGSIAGYTSQISVGECLSHPEKKRDQAVVSAYESMFQGFPNLSIIDIGWGVARTASKIRAKYTSLRAPDAIQIAAALWEGISLLLTNDKQLKQVKELSVLTFDDFC